MSQRQFEDRPKIYIGVSSNKVLESCSLHCQATKLVFHCSSVLFKSSLTYPSANCCFTFLGLNLNLANNSVRTILISTLIFVPIYLIRDLRIAHPLVKT